MDLFGVGPVELIVILVLALILFGPERLPEMAAKAGRTVRQLREISQAFTEEFQREVAQAGELKETTEMLQREVEALKQEANVLRGEIVEVVEALEPAPEDASAEAEPKAEAIPPTEAAEGQPKEASEREGGQGGHRG